MKPTRQASEAFGLDQSVPAASNLAQRLTSENEAIWARLGKISEMVNEPEHASFSYENVLRHNPYNAKALAQVASLYRMREQYPQAVTYFRRILEVDETNGDIWSELGHCYLMTDELSQAYAAYQNALYHLTNPKVGQPFWFLSLVDGRAMNRTPSCGMVLASYTTDTDR